MRYKEDKCSSQKELFQPGDSSVIVPGPCINECPPPTEIVCIKTEKVYESCRKMKVNEDIIDLTCKAEGDLFSVTCKDAELVVSDKHPFKCEKIKGTNRARVAFYYRVTIEYVDSKGMKWLVSEPIFHQEVVIMSPRIQEKDLQVQCEVFLECLECFVSGPRKVTCCIGKLMVFKLVALVQLLIPAYGFCPEPEECVKVEDACPEFFPVWPPYPPQEDFDFE